MVTSGAQIVMKRIWSNPISAMIWEAWGPHKLGFALHGLILLVSLAIVSLQGLFPASGLSSLETYEASGDILPPLRLALQVIPFLGFAAAVLLAIYAFSFSEMNSTTGDGYPRRLLLKPLSTFRLAFTPMWLGAAALF